MKRPRRRDARPQSRSFARWNQSLSTRAISKAVERYYMKKEPPWLKHDGSLLWLVDCFSDYSALLRH
jgi:hypothetical protein